VTTRCSEPETVRNSFSIAWSQGHKAQGNCEHGEAESGMKMMKKRNLLIL